MLFNIGDEVKYIGSTSRVKFSSIGTIVGIDDPVISVQWNKNIDGHTCGGYAKEGHGWNVHAEDLKLWYPSITNPADAKYVAVIRKSKQLTKRFENRKKGIDYVIAT